MKIKILGVGLTQFGELWDKSLLDLAREAGELALTDAEITRERIDAVYVGNMLSGRLSHQDHLGAAVSSVLGLSAPAFKVEGACASGGLAVHNAVLALKSGLYETVLVLGVEKMTDFEMPEVASALMGAGSEEERKAGLTFPGLYALMARAHMNEFGTTREQMAHVAVKNHYNASLNHKAQFPFEISIEKVLNSPRITDPFTLLDASPITDGAAAVILTTNQKSEIRNPKSVYITASSVSTDTLDLSSRKSLTELVSTKEAAQKAYKQAGVTPRDIDVVEVHDCFTIAEIMAMEDLGFCKKGEGGEFVASGATKIGKELPVNTSGGLKACGHPVGATGVKQIVELTEQLQGRAGKKQVEGAKVALAQNVGGTGGTAVVHVLQI